MPFLKLCINCISSAGISYQKSANICLRLPSGFPLDLEFGKPGAKLSQCFCFTPYFGLKPCKELLVMFYLELPSLLCQLEVAVCLPPLKQLEFT